MKARRAIVLAATITWASAAWADGPGDQKSPAEVIAALQTNRAVMAEVLGASACLRTWERKVIEDELASVAKQSHAEEKRTALRAELYRLDEIAEQDKARLSRLPDLEPLGCNDPGVVALMMCKRASGKKAGKRASRPAACTAPKIALEQPLVFDPSPLVGGR